MSSLEEIGKILDKNLLACSDEGTQYVVHKDDSVTVKDSKGKSWNIFRKALRYEKGLGSNPIENFVITTKHPSLYEPGIRVSRNTVLPYDMRVLVKSENGELVLEKLDYDETLIENAEKNGVKVQIWER